MAIDFLQGINAYNQAKSRGGISATEEQSSSAVGGDVFSGLVSDAIKSNVTNINSTEQVISSSLMGKQPLHEVVLSINEAEVALQTIVAVRDKVIAAYQDIIKMPI